MFDEVQKVAAGVLDSMSGVMDTGMLSRNVNGIVQTVRAASAVFILISDIGSESMIETLMDRHGDALVAREMISQKSIRSVVRSFYFLYENCSNTNEHINTGTYRTGQSMGTTSFWKNDRKSRAVSSSHTYTYLKSRASEIKSIE